MANGAWVTASPARLRPMAEDWKTNSRADPGTQRGASSIVSPWVTSRMRIVREEMDKIGQEFYLPALHPREVWEVSGRWGLMGENLFRLKDRKGADMCLGMTEEEVMTSIALKELRSYKQLPQIWYQIAPKFRDEPRPRSGLLRVRQFMKASRSRG